LIVYHDVGGEMEGSQIDFMELRLVPGQLFQLEFENYTGQRDKSVLIGYRKNGSLIVTLPSSAMVKGGDSVKVRFFAGTKSSACAFQSEVIYASKSPYPHLHLKLPSSVFIEEVRRSVRAEVEVVTQVEYFMGEEPKSTTAKIVDLSMNGARMIGRTFEFKADTDIMLTFKIDVTGIENDMTVKARVRSLNEIEKGIGVGLQFEDVPPSDKIALQAFVLSKIHDL